MKQFNICWNTPFANGGGKGPDDKVLAIMLIISAICVAAIVLMFETII